MLNVGCNSDTLYVLCKCSLWFLGGLQLCCNGLVAHRPLLRKTPPSAACWRKRHQAALETGVARMWPKASQYIRAASDLQSSLDCTPSVCSKGIAESCWESKVPLRLLDPLPLGSEQGKTERMGWLVPYWKDTTWLTMRQRTKSIGNISTAAEFTEHWGWVSDLEESSSGPWLAGSPTAWWDCNARSCQNAAQSHTYSS